MPQVRVTHPLELLATPKGARPSLRAQLHPGPQTLPSQGPGPRPRSPYCPISTTFECLKFGIFDENILSLELVWGLMHTRAQRCLSLCMVLVVCASAGHFPADCVVETSEGCLGSWGDSVPGEGGVTELGPAGQLGLSQESIFKVPSAQKGSLQSPGQEGQAVLAGSSGVQGPGVRKCTFPEPVDFRPPPSHGSMSPSGLSPRLGTSCQRQQHSLH